jgi:hypothetical protein
MDTGMSGQLSAELQRTTSNVANTLNAGADAGSAAPTRSGGDKRTVFKLVFSVHKLQLDLLYEGFALTPLAMCSVTDFDLKVDIHPDTLHLASTLGNAQVDDCSLSEDNPYRRACGLRSDTGTSLINLDFRCALNSLLSCDTCIMAAYVCRCVWFWFLRV